MSAYHPPHGELVIRDGAQQTALSVRLRTARRGAFVGRSEELEIYRAALEGKPGAPAVMHVHGPGGVGRSALLLRFAEEAEAQGRTVIHLDGRTLLPMPAAFEEKAADVLMNSRTKIRQRSSTGCVISRSSIPARTVFSHMTWFAKRSTPICAGVTRRNTRPCTTGCGPISSNAPAQPRATACCRPWRR
ncbi:ATP-binding protein [Streptomyces flaveus]|uniref:ATP-binding protein n=1 Tax=Streptomyces flaveus TaxID=66370 RepID=UPI00332454F1